MNLWKALGGRVAGPTFVRVSEFLDSDELKVQTVDERNIYVKGTDFKSVVQKK